MSAFKVEFSRLGAVFVYDRSTNALLDTVGPMPKVSSLNQVKVNSKNARKIHFLGKEQLAKLEDILKKRYMATEAGDSVAEHPISRTSVRRAHVRQNKRGRRPSPLGKTSAATDDETEPVRELRVVLPLLDNALLTAVYNRISDDEDSDSDATVASSTDTILLSKASSSAISSAPSSFSWCSETGSTALKKEKPTRIMAKRKARENAVKRVRRSRRF